MTKVVVNVHEAKTQLSRLIERALAGDEVVIARAGKPAVVLSPAPPPAKPKRPRGVLDGKIWIAPDAFDPDPELEALFDGAESYDPE